MKNIWGYISAALGGALLMLIIAYKWLAGDDYTIEVRKIKNKRIAGDVDIVVDSTQDVAENDKKRRKKRKRRE
jgi:hypothetical protein